MTEYWDPLRYGCIQRNSFRLRPVNRTELTRSEGVPPMRSKTGDVRAPISANFATSQTFAQFTAFTQWHRYDLAGGARPFLIDLWLWGQVRRVRVRFMGTWKAQREAHNTFQIQGVFEIEREAIQ